MHYFYGTPHGLEEPNIVARKQLHPEMLEWDSTVFLSSACQYLSSCRGVLLSHFLFFSLIRTKAEFSFLLI